MIFCQMKVRVKLPVTETLYLDQAATVRTDKPLQLHIPLTCPQKVGVWNLEAADAALALQQAYPQESVTMLGPDTCYVHRMQVKQRDWSKPLRMVAAFAVLMFGSALGLAWFHSDVDMPRAMEQLFTLLTGNSPPDARWITIPYTVGVALGVCVFYAIPRKNAVTPLEVKLTEYQGDMEQTEGQSIHGDE